MRIFWLLWAVTSILALELPKDGDRVLPITLPDQYGNSITFKEDLHLILYIPDKDASEVAKAFLKNKESGYLRDKKMAVVSDLSSVPSFVRSVFILPDLRTYPFTMLVIEDEFSPVIFESELGKVSVVFLDNGRQKKVKKAATVEAIEALINEDK